jgi:hypothetical protein
MSGAAAQVVTVQELCDQVVSCIVLDSSYQHLLQSTSTVCHKDTAQKASCEDDLRSSALVSHALCVSAQSQLFRHIILDPYECPGYPSLWPDTAHKAAACTLERLTSTVTTSPHLLRLIRSISVLAQSKILKRLSTLHFPALNNIRFDFVDTQSRDREAFKLVQDLIALPSIREVEIVRHRGLDLTGFTSLFDTCTSQLASVTFRGFAFPSSVPSSPDHVPTKKRAQVKRLTIVCGQHIEGWLSSPSCPLDFTHLLDVELNHETQSSLSGLLVSARLTIKRLAIFFFRGIVVCAQHILFPLIQLPEVTLQINLSEFPALTWLETDLWAYRTIGTTLPDANRVENLVLKTHISDFDESGKTLFCSPTDAFIAKAPMPALQGVEIRLSGVFNEAGVDGGWFQLSSIRTFFPQLQARGVLTMSDHRGAYSSKGPITRELNAWIVHDPYQ